MINDEICRLREKLNDSIINGENYEKIYQISVELDELIANYYKEEYKKQKTKENKEILKLMNLS